MHVIAAKAVAFKEALSPEFKKYCDQIIKNAKVLADVFLSRGYKLVSGGTDTHLILVNLSDKTISGKEAEEALGRAGITVNKNTIPFDPEKPFVTSGIRIGTPALTTRGMKAAEMTVIAELIGQVLSNVEDENIKKTVSGRIAELCKQFPLYA